MCIFNTSVVYIYIYICVSVSVSVFHISQHINAVALLQLSRMQFTQKSFVVGSFVAFFTNICAIQRNAIGKFQMRLHVRPKNTHKNCSLLSFYPMLRIPIECVASYTIRFLSFFFFIYKCYRSKHR